MKLHIPPQIHAEIMYHVNKSSVEVSGLGRVKRTTHGNLIVTKVYLLDQENSAVTTDIDPEALAALQYESREDEGDLNFWWHSHVNMGVNWSGTDTDTFEEFGKHGMLIGTVFNKKGEHRTAYYQGGNDFFPFVWVDNIPTHFGHLPSKEQIDVWEKDHKAKCKAKTYPKTNKWSPSSSLGLDNHGWKWDQRLQRMVRIENPNTVVTHSAGVAVNNSRYAMSLADDTPPQTQTEGNVTLTYSGELLEEVFLECEAHLEENIEWEAIIEYDRFYWWDAYEYLYELEPTEDAVEQFYNQMLVEPHLFGMMYFQKETELLEQENFNAVHTTHNKPNKKNNKNKNKNKGNKK